VTIDSKEICLALLSEGEASGYDIKQSFEETFGHFLDVSFGSIYPALRALEEEGLVTSRTVTEGRRPQKTLYKVTAKGLSSLVESLKTSDASHRVRSDFMAVIYFAALLPAARIEELLQGQVDEYSLHIENTEVWLDSDEGQNAPAGHRFIAGYARAIMDASSEFIRSHRDELLREIRKR